MNIHTCVREVTNKNHRVGKKNAQSSRMKKSLQFTIKKRKTREKSSERRTKRLLGNTGNLVKGAYC